MPTITFDGSEAALSALRLSPLEFVKEMRVAAEIAGTSRAEFIDELAHRQIPVAQVTVVPDMSWSSAPRVCGRWRSNARAGEATSEAEPGVLHRTLIENGYVELPVTGVHAAATSALPPIHKDPFDRLLLAQAVCEGITLVTADEILARNQ